MSEIFMKEDITSLLDNRFIVIIGDSIQRGVYKDLVLLLQRNKYLTDGQLRSKGEFTFSGDKLLEGGQYEEMSNGVKYREVRQYQTDYHLVRFYFVTRCYNSYVESILSDLSKEPRPDVILMNSCLWDISRYGASAVDDYKENLNKLFTRFKEALPESCLVIWNMTLPISKKARGGFLIPAIEFMNSTLRLDILEANFFVHKLALQHGYNVLDLHYFLRHQLQRRAGDGVHWDMTAHRRITNLILTHIAQAWNVKPPEHTKNILFKDHGKKQTGNKVESNAQPSLPFNPRPVFSLPGNFSPQITNNIINNFSQNLINNMESTIRQGVMVEQYVGNGNTVWSNEQVGCPVIEENQQENIIRYGGPIRRSEYQADRNVNIISMGNQQCVGNMNWEPYMNQEYNPNLRGQFWDHKGERNNPYSGKGNNQRSRTKNYR